LYGDRYFGDCGTIGVKFCIMAYGYIGPGQVLSFWGVIPQGSQKSKILAV